MQSINIFGLISYFPILVKLEIRIGSFRSDSNFEHVLPLNEGAYLSPMLTIAICDGFLLNPSTNNCWNLCCPIHGLKVVPNNGWMYYRRLNGKLLLSNWLNINHISHLPNVQLKSIYSINQEIYQICTVYYYISIAI